MRAAIILLFVLAMAVPAAAQVGPPNNFELLPTTPEPFCGSVTINYTLADSYRIEIDIMDVSLTQFYAIVVAAYQSQGSYQVIWDALDFQGEPLPDGVYAVVMKVWLYPDQDVPIYLEPVLATQSCPVPGGHDVWSVVKDYYR